MDFCVDDVIRVLQMYKPAAQKVFRGKVNLFFDREKKEILFEISIGGGFYDKDIVYKKLSYKTLGLEDLLPCVYTLRLVDGWIEELEPAEAEVLFWKYINHDFEKRTLDSRFYEGLSFEEISERMGISKVQAWRLARKAIRKILDMIDTIS
ncbi:MAG: sigma factor-like helix-turn-helix DNA-binding protein [Nitrososphaerota archaeon]